MATMCACSDDEPKADDKVTTPGTEQPDEELPDTGDDNLPDLSEVTSGSNFMGMRYIVDGSSYWYEGMSLSIKPTGGKLEYGIKGCYTKNQKTQFKKYNVSYNIVGNMLECVCQDTESDETLLLSFEYLDGKLHMRTPQFKPLILGNGKMINVDTEGKIIDRSDAATAKIWMHENGINILDLRNLMAIQLKSPDSKEYDYVQKFYRERQPAWSSVLQMSYLPSDHYQEVYWFWDVLELTEDKMVLGTTLNNTQYINVYHACSEKDIPHVEDLKSVLLASQEWIHGADTGLASLTYSFTFSENGRFTFWRYDTYASSGTYGIVGNQLNLNFDYVSFIMEWPDGESYEGFINGQSRKMTCNVEVNNLSSITIDMPDIGEYTFRSKFSRKWNLPVNTTHWSYINDSAFSQLF